MKTHSAWPVFAGINLERERVFETRDVDEAQRLCSEALGAPHVLRLRNGRDAFRSYMERAQLGPMALCRLGWSGSVSVDPGTLDNSYLLSLPTQGGAEYQHGADSFTLASGQAAFVGGGERFHFEAPSGFDQFLVCFDRRALDEAWGALIGEPSNKPIRFHSQLATDGAGWRAIEPTLHMLANATRSGGVGPLLHLHARLQDMLLTALLLNQPHSHMKTEVPVGNAAPSRVRRAQSYMQEHIDQPLTLTGIAQAVGIPARTLQWAFQSSAGMGPMQWLREQRLNAVRDALVAGSEIQTSVSDTAFRFGFTHLGEFSQHYRRAFGESPRQTLLKHQ